MQAESKTQTHVSIAADISPKTAFCMSFSMRINIFDIFQNAKVAFFSLYFVSFYLKKFKLCVFFD